MAGRCGNKWTEYEVVRWLLTLILSQQGHCLQAALQGPLLPGCCHEFIAAARALKKDLSLCLPRPLARCHMVTPGF